MGSDLVSTRTFSPFERLRRLWTPQREIEEFFSNLEPGTALDSMVREWFSRIVWAERSLTIDITNPVPPFTIRWEVVNVGTTGKRELTVWAEPSGD